MTRLEYAERFANDLALIRSPKVEARILENLDNIERFGEFGTLLVPPSIKREFGDNVRARSRSTRSTLFTRFIPSKTSLESRR